MPTSYRWTAYDEADYDGVTRIALAIDPDAFSSVQRMREWDDVQRAAGRLSSRWHAFIGDELVGTGYLGEPTWTPPDMMWMYLMGVRPDRLARWYKGKLSKAEALRR